MTTLLIIGSLISAFVGAAYYSNRVKGQMSQIHQKMGGYLIEQSLTDNATDQLIISVREYTTLHSENAARIIQILDEHLSETGTTLNADHASSLAQIQYYYHYSTIH